MAQARTITASICGDTIIYTDESGNDGEKKHIKKGDADTFSWNSPDGTIKIDFPDGNPFDPQGLQPPYSSNGKGQPTSTVTCVKAPAQRCYKYEVTVTLDDQSTVDDDPIIIFDDGLIVDRVVQTKGAGELKDIANSAQQALDGVFNALTKNAQVKRDPNALFFPFGITSIEANVVVGPATVDIKVSGPESAKGS